jgi:hypothetical protein
MTTTEAKRWVQRYFRTFDQHGGSDELYTVVWALCGCFGPLPERLREEYAGAETYHDLWREVMTDRVIEGIDDPRQWLDELYPIYVHDMRVHREPPEPSKDGFRTWLAGMVDAADVEQCLQTWPPKDRT